MGFDGVIMNKYQLLKRVLVVSVFSFVSLAMNAMEKPLVLMPERRTDQPCGVTFNETATKFVHKTNGKEIVVISYTINENSFVSNNEMKSVKAFLEKISKRDDALVWFVALFDAEKISNLGSQLLKNGVPLLNATLFVRAYIYNTLTNVIKEYKRKEFSIYETNDGCLPELLSRISDKLRLKHSIEASANKNNSLREKGVKKNVNKYRIQSLDPKSFISFTCNGFFSDSEKTMIQKEIFSHIAQDSKIRFLKENCNKIYIFVPTHSATEIETTILNYFFGINAYTKTRQINRLIEKSKWEKTVNTKLPWSNIEKVCNNKGCLNDGNKQCSKCHSALYCSTDCQKKDWATHKLKCKK